MTDNKKNRKGILFLLLGMFWIYLNHIPLIPIGLIIGLILLIKKRIKKYLVYLIIGLIVGFLGTGVAIDINKQLIHNQSTGKEFTKHNFGMRLKLGFKSINNIRNKGKIVIYNNEKFNFDISDGKGLTDNFIKHFNEYEFDTLIQNLFTLEIDSSELKQFMTNVYDKTGNIEDYKFLGISDYFERNDSSEYYIFYDISTQKQSEFDYLALRILDSQKKDIINKIDFIFETTKFRIENK